MIHFISFRCIFKPICCLFEAEIYRKYTDHLSPRSLQISTLALDMQPDKSSKKSCCYERKTSESSWLTWTCYIIWRDMSFNRDHHVEQWHLGTGRLLPVSTDKRLYFHPWRFVWRCDVWISGWCWPRLWRPPTKLPDFDMFFWFWCLASKQTHWFHQKTNPPPKKNSQGATFFFQRFVQKKHWLR